MKFLFTVLSLFEIVKLIYTTNDIPTIAHAAPFVKGNETDRLALLAIKSKITHDPLQVLDSWNDSSHFCLWEGITCGRRHKRVTMIDLSSYGLVGSLSPFIGNLSFLRILSMYNNTFSGHIPPEIGRLSRLEQLTLLNNSFQGEIPTNISGCTQLVWLELYKNELVGKLPFGLSFLSKLEFLELGGNSLTGDNLSPLENLTSLKVLELEDQVTQGLGFYGKIPDFIGNFKDLVGLYLEGNSFTGMIPRSLYNLSKLQELTLGYNQLEGYLPSDLGFRFPQIQVLQLNNNKLSGPIPFSLSNLSKLEMLNLEHNNFTGKILFDGSNMPSLVTLELGATTLGGGEVDELDFLNTLANCSNLQVLDVYNNNLGGKIPDCIANLSVLSALDLHGNLISGVIPSGFGNLLSLEFLSLWSNQLNGNIPSDIGKIAGLEILYLDSNSLSGSIPSSLGNLSWLSRMYLSYNKFNGFLPSTLGNCTNLIEISLSYNKLVGSIPHKLFEASELVELDLRENMLQGSLPSKIGDLKNLELLGLSNNNLSGSIPSSLGRCLGLTTLFLHDNYFNQSIPPSLSNLQGLQYIDLSNNKLSGQVPNYFSNFTDLIYLNLSYNDLEGDVPMRGVFANVSAIFLLGNNKLCGGIPQLKLPRCAFIKLKATKKSHALTFAISISCFVVVLAVVLTTYLFCTKKKKQASSETLSKDPLFIQVSYGMLLKATNGFSTENLVGSGNFSSVYKGALLIDGAEKSVAVKVINNQRQGATQSFLAECEALRVIRHRNLVRVLTACSSIDYQGNVFNAIVYEFMSKGSLESWLYLDPEFDGQFHGLSLLQRLNIAIDVAHGVDYIQSVCETPFVHCDLKPSNILLDGDFVAHVGDFGLVKLPPEIANELPNYVSLGVRGTVGYTAPEYGLGTSMSAAGDVYSYGITLLEVMTARKPTDASFKGDMNLHKFAKSALPDQVQEILDPRLKINDYHKDISIIDLNDTFTNPITKCAIDCITSMITIGVQCSSELPQERMDIKDVIRQLQSRKDQLLELGRRHRSQTMI